MSFASALNNLQQQLRAVTASQPGFLRLSATVTDPSDGLAWLDAQPVWPKFYWQHRSGEQTLMALGEVQRAETLQQASQLLRALPAGAVWWEPMNLRYSIAVCSCLACYCGATPSACSCTVCCGKRPRPRSG